MVKFISDWYLIFKIIPYDVVMIYSSEIDLTTKLLPKNPISALESLAGVPTPSVFSALIFAFLSTQLKWSIHFPMSIIRLKKMIRSIEFTDIQILFVNKIINFGIYGRFKSRNK